MSVLHSAMLAGALAGLACAAQAQTAIATGVPFPEGPYVDGDLLYFTQYGGHVVSVWDGTEVKTLWQQDGCGPSAVAPLGDGFVVTCYDNGTLARIGRDGADAGAIAADSGGAPLQGPNDLAPDGQGGVWVTASGPWESGPIVGKVYHLSAEGVLTLAADDLHYANGVVVGPDGRLYVNESEAGRVISFAIGPDFTLSDRRLFVRIGVVDEGSGIGAYPDGIKLGPDGNFWVGQYSSGRIVVVAPDGSLVAVHEVPSPAAPNLAFSADGKTAYVTAVDDTANPPYPGTVWAIPVEP